MEELREKIHPYNKHLSADKSNSARSYKNELARKYEVIVAGE